MKNLAKLNGAKALSKTEQKSVNGGGSYGDGLNCMLLTGCPGYRESIAACSYCLL